SARTSESSTGSRRGSTPPFESSVSRTSESIRRDSAGAGPPARRSRRLTAIARGASIRTPAETRASFGRYNGPSKSSADTGRRMRDPVAAQRLFHGGGFDSDGGLVHSAFAPREPRGPRGRGPPGARALPWRRSRGSPGAGGDDPGPARAAGLGRRRRRGGPSLDRIPARAAATPSAPRARGGAS